MSTAQQQLQDALIDHPGSWPWAGERGLRGQLQAAGEFRRRPGRDDLSALLSHGRQVVLAASDFADELCKLLYIERIKGEAIPSVNDQIMHATARSRNEHG